MKYFTKSLLTASLALGAVTANAAIINNNEANAEPWLSVFDSASKQTFTYDLGDFATAKVLYDNAQNPNYSISVDLSSFTDWTDFKNIVAAGTGSLSTTTQYAVISVFEENFSQKLMLTGTDTDKFVGLDFAAYSGIANTINVHANGINADTASGVITIGGTEGLLQETSTVNESDGTSGGHSAGGGSTNLWGGATYNPNADYGTSIAMQLGDMNLGVNPPEGLQSQFIGEWKLDGDLLTYNASVTAVPLPAAVWMFGSVLLGFLGFNRKKAA